MDRLERVVGGISIILAGVAGAILTGLFLLVACNEQTTQAASQPTLVAKQFDNNSCVLAAIATHLNYREGSNNYSARGLALAYTARYGTSDWWKDGNTSHQAQELARFAGLNPVYGKLTDGNNDPVGRLKYLAWSGKMPVVFLAGSPEHAVVLVGAYIDRIFVADPLDGSVRTWNASTLYDRLDSEKWVFYTE
ncbi:MAG TPA: hypothetical protein VH186_16910 [Chloroflexia bacterium]|nr:hypothetical protein [Chloroflexia bacterium]